MTRRSRWLASVNDSARLSHDAKRVARALAEFADEAGRITDPEILALLQDLEREQEAEQS